MKDFVKPVLILFCICVVMTGALALTNSLTSPIISEAATERMNQTMREIIPAATDFTELTLSSAMPAGVQAAYASTNGVGHIFRTASNGYGGDVVLLVGIDVEGKLIKVSVFAHSETQGLGTAVFDYADTVYPGIGASEVDGIDAISGATITSEAYRRAVRDAFAAFALL